MNGRFRMITRSLQLGSSFYPVVFLTVLVLFFAVGAARQFFSIRKKVIIVSCNSVKEMVSAAHSAYKSLHPEQSFFPGQIINMEELYSEGLLKEYHNCPNGGAYMINRFGNVFCTFHEYKEQE
ncbi:MAG: hypothetical protein PHQ23_01195 [Candidatus Wallbacteria bacterium]|nr:hypothetical protein [Candidatus Wallbacteria bacterium]